MYNLRDIQLPSSIEAQDSYFVIAGFAYNGPVNVPFMIRDGADPYMILGECPMADAAVVARNEGVQPLLLRINGSFSTVILDDLAGQPVGTFTSVEADDNCDSIRISMYPTYMRITDQWGSERYYLFTDYPTLGDLSSIVNKDAQYGMGCVTFDVAGNEGVQTNGLVVNAYDMWMKGGDDGSNLICQFDGTDDEDKFANQLTLLREALLDEGTDSNGLPYYDFTGELIAFNIDTIVVPDIPFENNSAVAEVLGKFAETKSTDQDSYCNAVVGSMLFNDVESDDYLYQPMIDQLIALKPITNDGWFSHTEVVIGVEEGNLENTKMAVATKFAVMRYLLPIHLSATNKEIKDITTLFTSLPKEDIASLSASGYTCIIPSLRKGHVAYKSISFVPDQSLISSRPHLYRAARFYTNQLITSLDSFVGEAATAVKVTAMEQLLRANIANLEVSDVFKSIDYTIQRTTVDQVELTLTFYIYGDIEAVHTSASYDPIRKTVIQWT
jgi:hypothetical protein